MVKQNQVLEGAYLKAKAAAEDALRAGVVLAAKPEEAPPPNAANAVEILDALYGESEVLRQVEQRWQASPGAISLKDFVPSNGSGRYCPAKDYVRFRCQFDEAVPEFCLHKDYLKNPGMPAPFGPCAGDYNGFKVQWRRAFKQTKTSCTLTVQLDQMCGFPAATAPVNDRHALVLYRCGQAGKPQLKPASNTQTVYLLCE